MRVVAIHTSRAGSVGVPGKNTAQVGGKPLFRYGLDACIGCRRISRTIVASDVEEILSFAVQNELVALPLPPEIANGNHYGAIRAAAEHALREDSVDAFAIVLGNAVGASAGALDDAITRLASNDDADSVVSVSAFPMFTPLRAFARREGRLETQVSAAALRIDGPLNDRTSAETPWFFNGSFWVVRTEPLLANSGPGPFPWLGARLLAHPQRPLMELDEPWQVAVLPHLLDE